MASVIFNHAMEAEANGDIDYGADTFYVMLVTSSYVPNRDTHDFRNSVTNEVTGTGYTAGGQAATVVVTRDDANDRINITLGGATWAGATITARAAVYYKHRGGASSADELIAYIDFGSNIVATATAFVLTDSTLRKQG